MTEFRCFLDTNLLVYLYSNDQKSVTVEKLIHSHFSEICLSTQVLNELYSVLTRKNLKPKEEAQIIVNDLIENYRIYCLDEQCIQRAIKINIHYHFSYWDSLIIAAALEVGCSTLYSEDLQNNQVIENSLTLLNPFLLMKE